MVGRTIQAGKSFFLDRRSAASYNFLTQSYKTLWALPFCLSFPCPMIESPPIRRYRSLFLSLLFIGAVLAASAKEPEDATWSAESNGLRARVTMRRHSVLDGTCIIATYLELKNVGIVANPMVLEKQPLTFTVTDADGHEVPRAGGGYDGVSVKLPPLTLPHDSQLRYQIGPTGWGVTPNMAAALDLGFEYNWELPRDGKAYYLQGSLEVPRQKNDRSGDAILWHGKLVLPRVRIPTEPDPVDPKTLGARIDELGAQMLDANWKVSQPAVNELSLIDDPLVIPWYLKAVKSDSYSLRYAAIDRLSRMEGDEALEGLKIAMATKGADMGHCASQKVADDLAAGIRATAAYGLARSPHPQAKSLLWTMEKDLSKTVRLIVVQTASREATPETLAILQRGAQDADPMVREQAAGYLKEREKAK